MTPRFLFGALALALLAAVTTFAQEGTQCEDQDVACFKAARSVWEIQELKWDDNEGTPTPAMRRAVAAQTDVVIAVLRAVPALARGVSVWVSPQARYDGRRKVATWNVLAKVTPLCLGPACEEVEVPGGEVTIFANDLDQLVDVRRLVNRNTKEGLGPAELFGDYTLIWHHELVPQGDLGGMHAFDEGAFITRGGRLPWKPVAQEALIQQLINHYAYMAKGERQLADIGGGEASFAFGYGKILPAVKAELAALTPAERTAQAHFIGPSHLSQMLEIKGLRPSGLAAPGTRITALDKTVVARPVAAIDPTFFDQRNPAAVQFLIVHTSRRDGENNEAFEQQVMRALDYRRLASLVRP